MSTTSGVLRSVVVPSPSCPNELAPQHATPPLTPTAHVWKPPALTAWSAPKAVDTWTGVALLVVVPLPSWPWKSLPQQYASLPIVTPHVWLFPPLTVVKASGAVPEAVTCAGAPLFLVRPFPSCPQRLGPQQ